MKQFGFIILLLLNRYSQSLLCYDCYDTGPSNEKCVKWKNCTGEACLLYEGEDILLTTAFCLLNLPNHYRKQNKMNDAKCWMERNGKGKHCICLQDFCNHLRDRRFPLEGNVPLINASMINHNPLIDYDYLNENEAHFTFDLMNLEIDDESSLKDLIPIKIADPDYKDELESSLQRPIKPTSSPSSSSSSSNNNYHQLLIDNYTTKHILNQNSHFYTADEETKREQTYISTMDIVYPDQMVEEIKENTTVSKIASNNLNRNFTYFKIILFLKLFHTFYA
ncbi:unnamed protein product [Cercopithifilaria johnstoni]|uniref:Uncharacterized protein n=1 Tax=Cercopithifilaria johnstoni TaxID=2874296 RepID=A0A8J2PU81_9BILA|nr:unnamed protein product [Cercopithifilaria johnstoni]